MYEMMYQLITYTPLVRISVEFNCLEANLSDGLIKVRVRRAYICICI